MAATPALAIDEPCGVLADGDVIEGEFRWVETRHPNGEEIRAPVLVTGRRYCVDGELLATGQQVTVDGRWFQLQLRDDGRLADLIPGELYEVAADYEPTATAWHIGDIMAFDAVLVQAETDN